MKIACGIWLASMALIQGAGLEFTEPLKEINAPPDVKKVTADFEFTNRSDKPVTVTKYEPTCSCISLQIKDAKLRYAPGESGMIRAEFDMGNLSGTVDKVVAVWLDNDPADKPSMSLTVRVHIPVLVSLTPKTLKWDLNGKGEPQTIRISMHYQQAIRVTAVNASSDAFNHELKTVEEGKAYDLIITPLDIKTPCLGIFRIETDCKIEKHRIQQVFATVRRPSPANAVAPP
jgi:hypothetical protein